MLLSTHTAPPFYKNGYLLAARAPRGGNHRSWRRGRRGDHGGARIWPARHVYPADARASRSHHRRCRAKQAFSAPVLLHEADLSTVRRRRAAGLDVRSARRPTAARRSFLRGRASADVRGVPGAAPSHARTLSGRRVPPGGTSRTAGLDLFVGDTLFAGSIGRTDLPEATTDADSVDHVGSAGVPRRSARLLRARRADDHRHGNAGRTRFFGIDGRTGPAGQSRSTVSSTLPTRRPISRCELSRATRCVVDPRAVGALQVFDFEGISRA